MNNEEKKERKPRSRERGPGKNNKGKTARTISFSCSPEDYDSIKKLISESGISASQFFVKKILDRP